MRVAIAKALRAAAKKIDPNGGAIVVNNVFVKADVAEFARAMRSRGAGGNV